MLPSEVFALRSGDPSLRSPGPTNTLFRAITHSCEPLVARNAHRPEIPTAARGLRAAESQLGAKKSPIEVESPGTQRLRTAHVHAGSWPGDRDDQTSPRSQIRSKNGDGQMAACLVTPLMGAPKTRNPQTQINHPHTTDVPRPDTHPTPCGVILGTLLLKPISASGCITAGRLSRARGVAASVTRCCRRLGGSTLIRASLRARCSSWEREMQTSGGAANAVPTSTVSAPRPTMSTEREPTILRPTRAFRKVREVSGTWARVQSGASAAKAGFSASLPDSRAPGSARSRASNHPLRFTGFTGCVLTRSSAASDCSHSECASVGAGITWSRGRKFRAFSQSIEISSPCFPPSHSS